MKIKCRKCGDIIESNDRHDMVWCSCGKVAIDGGNDYVKISGWPEDILFVDEDGNELPKAMQHVLKYSRFGKEGKSNFIAMDGEPCERSDNGEHR